MSNNHNEDIRNNMDGSQDDNNNDADDDDDDDEGWESVPQKPERRKNKQQDNKNISSVLPWVSYIPPTTENTRFQPFMLLLCGIPGSGKSTFAKSLQEAMPYKFVRINQDDLGQNRRRCEELARSVLSPSSSSSSNPPRCPIIDRCNFDKDQRETFAAIASEYKVPIDCVVFTSDSDLVTVEECVQRCQRRRNHPSLLPHQARGVVMLMAEQMKPPTLTTRNQEGIRHVQYITDRNMFNDTIVEYLNKLK